MRNLMIGVLSVLPFAGSCKSKDSSSSVTSCELSLLLSGEADSSAASVQFGDVKNTVQAPSTCISFFADFSGYRPSLNLGSKAIGHFYKNISKCRKFAGLAAKCVGLTQADQFSKCFDTQLGRIIKR